MKNVLTKMGYMAIGCLLTLIGYHFGNVENNSVRAQQASENGATDIVGKLRVRQLEIVGNDNTSRIILGTNLDGSEIKFVGEDNAPQMYLKTTSNGGQITIQDPSGNDAIVAHNKAIYIDGPGEGPAVVLTTTSDGSGAVIVAGQDSSAKAFLTVDENGGYVGVFRADGEPLVFIGGTDEGKATVSSYDVENDHWKYTPWTRSENNKQTYIIRSTTTTFKPIKGLRRVK